MRLLHEEWPSESASLSVRLLAELKNQVSSKATELWFEASPYIGIGYNKRLVERAIKQLACSHQLCIEDYGVDRSEHLI